jgi:hypothetical protein
VKKLIVFLSRFLWWGIAAADISMALIYLSAIPFPYSEDRQVPFPCEPCGWMYGSEPLFSFVAFASGALIFGATWLSYRQRHRLLLSFALLLVTPALVYYANMIDHL